LRGRLLKSVLAVGLATVAALFFYEPIWWFAVQPYERAARSLAMPTALQAIGPGDAFLKSMWLCLIAGLTVVSPYVLWQMWGFVSAGLYPHEKRAVRVFFPVSIALFALGAAMAYVIVMPVGMQFLMAFSRGLGVSANFAVGPYLDMLTMFVAVLGLSFELPLVMLFLQAMGLVQRRTFVKGWRLAVVVAFVVAMVATPDPSPVSQILMALPLVGLYFLGVWGGRFVGEGKVAFTPLRAWPLALAFAVIVGLLFFAGEIADWGASLWR
jgi:sec-independent protein translocase protein TatC